MRERYVLHVTNSCTPALEIRLEPEARNPLRHTLQEWEQLHDVLAGDEPLRDALRRHIERCRIFIVVFGEADAVHDIQDCGKERATTVLVSPQCPPKPSGKGSILTNEYAF